MADLAHWCTSRLGERGVIRDFLNQDRSLTAYALGDLDEAFWPDSLFYGAWSGGRLAAVVLLYSGLEPPVLTAFGHPDGVEAVFAQQMLPGEIYYLFLPEMETILRARYDLPNCKREWRMVLDRMAFASSPSDFVTRLGPQDAGALKDLYRHAAEPGEEVVAFSPWQIEHGVFYGVWNNGELVATAGTHVWSPAEGVAAIGNVFTRPDWRGKGYATACTAAVTAEALSVGLESIVLNVRHDNVTAIHVYEKLGFRLYRTFLEGPGLRRG